MARKQQMAVIRDTWQAMQDPDGESTQQKGGPAKKKNWIHDNNTLLYGTVQYKGKFLGVLEVEDLDDSKGTVARVVRELKKTSSKLPEVEISISIRALIITEIKSKMHICKLKLQKIAYCSDDCDGGGHKFFSFISRKIDTKKADQKVTLQCYCIETQNIAHKITQTVGQAFQLAYERFQEAKVASESFVVEMKKVKAKRIKKNYGKELAELHHHPATTEEDDEERDTFPDASHPRMSRRASKDITQQWEELNETLKLVYDVKLPLPNSDTDFDEAFESIQSEIDEWSQARSPYQSELEVHDALKQLDSVLGGSDSSIQLNSDSQTLLEEGTSL